MFLRAVNDSDSEWLALVGSTGRYDHLVGEMESVRTGANDQMSATNQREEPSELVHDPNPRLNASLDSALQHIAVLLNVSDRGHPAAERFLEAHGGRFDGRRWLAPGESPPDDA